MPILEAHGIHKTFIIPSSRRMTVREHALELFRPQKPQRLQVLEGIDLRLEPGEALGIMGRNGSGKSTLLKILAGIYPPDHGKVIRHAPITPLLELGVGWNPELDAIDNVYLLGTVMGMTLREVRDALDEILAFAEVEPFAHLKLKFYSTGMAARLAYAVAFRAVREILILDEIFAVGDQGFKNRCRERYAELRDAGHSILMVSHEPAILAESCDRAVLLDSGKILRQGSAEEITEAYLELLT